MKDEAAVGVAQQVARWVAVDQELVEGRPRARPPEVAEAGD